MKGRSFEENADDLNTKKRRKIREKQKSLYDDIHTAKVNLSSVESKSFQDFRGKLNDIFVEVDHPREQQSDAVSFKVLSMSAKQQSSNMLDSSFQFNFQSLATKVSEKFSHKGVFSWTNFGKSVQHLDQSRVPEFSCMLGPMNKGEKLRKQMTKKNKEDMNDIVTEIPEEIFQEDQDGDEATNERLKVLYDLFATKITNTAKGGKEYPVFDMLRLLVDPSDRVQTIENFFDFSFLIKVIETILIVFYSHLCLFTGQAGYAGYFTGNLFTCCLWS
jgi:hypothetical protein